PFLIERPIAPSVRPRSETFRTDGAHPSSLGGLAAPPPTHDVLVRLLVLLARLLAFRLPPRRDRRPPARPPTLAAVQRLVDRVHRHTTHLRTPPTPPVRTGLPDALQLVVDVPHLPDRRQALPPEHPHLRRRQPQGHVVPLLRHHLRT